MYGVNQNTRAPPEKENNTFQHYDTLTKTNTERTSLSEHRDNRGGTVRAGLDANSRVSGQL